MISFLAGVVTGGAVVLGILHVRDQYHRWIWRQMNAKQKRDAIARALTKDE